MKATPICLAAAVISTSLLCTSTSKAATHLLAVGTLASSKDGAAADLSGLNYQLENGAPANLLGGLGSAITYASGSTFLALPDRGPNATPFAADIDDTVSYIDRFHTITMNLQPNEPGSSLPFSLSPKLERTTPLWSTDTLVYGTGKGLGVGSGVPPANNFDQHFFTGRSDNFSPNGGSRNPLDARLDPEGIRVSNDGRSVFISDEYGPFVYQFDRRTGVRIRSFHTPDSFAVTNPQPVGDNEISGNTAGRTANKGMEGLAITPDGKTLIGIMQSPLLQDQIEGATNLLRLVTIDISSGRTTHVYAYCLTAGSGVSEILAINENEFIVDERDGKGRGDGSKAKVKQLFKISLKNAVDVSSMDGLQAQKHAVGKTLFLDIVSLLSANGFSASTVPAKIEGISFGPDVEVGSDTLHTLWFANDNDFLLTVADPNGSMIANPNQFFVVGFSDSDLGGSALVAQPIQPFYAN